MAMVETIRTKLSQALDPVELDVIDESYKHAGHVGAREGGESHFHVRIVSDIFIGKLPIARHRMVNAALREELQRQIHALSIETLTASEASVS